MEKLLKKKQKAEAENNKTLLTSVCIDLAEQYLNQGNYHTAIDEYKTVAMIYKQQNKMLDYACANRMIGEAYTHLQLYDRALQHEEIYLNVAQKEGNKMEEQRALATIGHIYLTMSLCVDEPNLEHLNQASKNFVNSLSVCEKLTGISKNEQMDMMARLFANLGVVKEAQGKYAKGIELVMKSVNICKKYDIFEQLERCYTTLSSIYCKSGDYSSAISNLNLGMEIAGRLPGKLPLTCSSLLAKSDILMKMSDLQGAKRVLHKAYKLKTPNKSDGETIERNLKIVTAMSYAEESLLITSNIDYQSKKTLYEKLGDGACHFKSYNSAIDYYKMMLDCAIKNGDIGKALSPCYNSLAQTYQDNKQFDKAIEYYTLDIEVSKGNVKETINTMFNVIAAMQLAGKNSQDVLDLFAKAQNECVASKKQLARVLERQILYLKQHFMLSEAAKLEPKLEELDCALSDSDSEVDDTTIALGHDVDIDNITDLSSSDDEKDLTTRSTRKRNRGLAVKRNTKGETQLHVATINGNVPLVAKLLEQGHVVNIRDHAGWLPIHEACIWGHLEVVKMLIDKGAAINDRGGTMCNGITPLHDAASNGHLEIMEYMLSKGASPLAKTDNGETSLYILRSWKDGVTLDDEQSALYNRLIDTMTNAMEKAGQHDTNNVLNQSNEALVFVEDETLSSSYVASRRPSRARTSTAVRNGSSGAVRVVPKAKTKFTSDLRRNIYAGDDDSMFTQQSVAASDYRNTIDLLRNSNSSGDLKRRKSTQQLSGFVSSNENDFDDWLEEDVNNSNKKKRRVTSPRLSLIRTSSASSFSSDILEVHSDDNAFINLENLEPSNAVTSGVKPSSTRRIRKSQTTLLKSGFSRTRESSSPVEFIHNSQFRTDADQVNKTQVKITTFVNNEEPRRQQDVVMKELDMNSTQSLIKNQMLFIDVRINEKLFRIPFPAKDLECLTINWLAKETTKRFYKKEAMKPEIEMETKNGAILCEDDLLSVLFPLGATQCEELQAKVVKWNVPPLRERYIDACQYLNIETCDQISNILDSTTVNLNLPDKHYREKLLPICRSLNRQTNLYELNLSGNLSGNKMLDALCESLPTLTNLTILILSTNHISCLGLSTFAATVRTTSILPGLRTLDLSYNPLGNECLKYLGDITSNLKLDKLHLCATDLATGIFSTTYNQNVNMDLQHLKEFDISYNRLDKKDLGRFLDFLNAEHLEVLNIGNNCIETNGFGNDLFKFLRKNDEHRIAIKRLNASRCMLNDQDIFDIQRALTSADQLDELNLSFNAFTGSSLKRLLVNTSPKRLNIIGCDELRHDCGSYNAPEWKFTEENRCLYLSSTFDYVEDFKQCDILIGMFRDVYQDNLNISGLDEGMLKLSVTG